MLWEPSKMEQRYDAVMGVIREGFTITEVAQKFGVSRQSVYTWMQRYQQESLEGLAEHSSRPKTSPARIDARIEARILELRRQHPSWGSVHLRWKLEREGVTPLPSESSVYRALRRSGLIEDKPPLSPWPTQNAGERSARRGSRRRRVHPGAELRRLPHVACAVARGGSARFQRS
jgi:transposase